MSWLPRSLHIVGIGGAGMSGLARYFYERGVSVSGSDRAPSDEVETLRALGVVVTIGNDVSHAAAAEWVTSSPAVAPDDADLVAAHRAGVRVLNRGEILGAVCAHHHVVAICGTHGKTTATSMLAHVYAAAGEDPSWLLGAPIRGLGTNGHFAGATLLLELDESFGTFARITPNALGILNIEADHLDHYGSFANLQAAFRQLAMRTNGPVVVAGDAATVDVVGAIDGVTVIGGPDAAIANETPCDEGVRFTLTGTAPLSIDLRVPGHHNVQNAAVVAALARRDGISDEAIVAGLQRFEGAPRRFQRHGRRDDTVVIEDYAHLPSELATTIATARQQGFERILAVFQPHRVTRTEQLAASFSGCFDGVTTLVVTDIYTSGEDNPRGLTGQFFLDQLETTSSSPAMIYVPSLDEAEVYLKRHAAQYDAVLVLGAGDVGTLAARLVQS